MCRDREYRQMAAEKADENRAMGYIYTIVGRLFN
jgi:hypothetical protein